MKSNNCAFSLIEMSIVILIVGILIAGATQGSRLVNASRLQMAQTITESSPVTGINNLITWLEPVKPNSFLASEAVDNTQITNWYNTNPQTYNSRIVAIDTAYTSAVSTVTYNLEGINNLPSVNFSAVSVGFSGPVVPTNFSAYTVFVVYRVTDITTVNDIFYNGTTGDNGFGLTSSSNGKLNLEGPFLNSVGSILAIAIAPDSSIGVAVANPAIASYINGEISTLSRTTLSTNIVTPTGNLFVGSDSTSTTGFIGDISEVIIYGKLLNKEDRQSVENYLGHKYAIEVTTSAT